MNSFTIKVSGLIIRKGFAGILGVGQKTPGENGTQTIAPGWRASGIKKALCKARNSNGGCIMDNKRTRILVATALMAALVVVLGFTPLGLIPLGFINVTTLCIPVIIGTLVLGLKPGLVLGGCFGLVSLYKAFNTPSALVMPIMQASIPSLIIMSLLPRLLLPIAAHATYKLFSRLKNGQRWGIVFAAIAGSLTNTLFYLGLMVLFYFWAGLDAPAIIGTVLSVAYFTIISFLC